MSDGMAVVALAKTEPVCDSESEEALEVLRLLWVDVAKQAEPCRQRCATAGVESLTGGRHPRVLLTTMA